MFLTISIPDIIAISIIILIIASAIFYIVKAKKKGNKCIGCPFSNTCSTSQKKQCSTQGDLDNNKEE